MKTQSKTWLVILALVPLLQGCDIPSDLTTQDGSTTASGTPSGLPSGQPGQQGQGGQQQQQQGSARPYNVQTIPGQTYIVVDGSGILIPPTSRPMQPGDHLVPLFNGRTDALEQAYVEVFETMAPLSDVLRFYPYSVTDYRWQEMTEPLTNASVLEFIPPRILSPGDVLACAQHDNQSPGITQFLVTSETALKCSLYDNAGVYFQIMDQNGQIICQSAEGVDGQW